MEYSIVTPAYNEEDKITATLTQAVGFMRGFSDSFEVIIVNDGSKDSTEEKVKAYSKDNPEVKLLSIPHKGKGVAVSAGIMAAEGKYIYMADADLSAPINELKKLSVWMIDQDYDIVIASREGVGAKRVGEPFYRHIMGRVFNIMIQILVLPGISDTQCGFKLFKNKVAKDVFGKLKIYNIEGKELQDAYLGAWDVEVLYLARKMGYTIKQVPVTWTYVKTTRLKPLKDSAKMALDVLKIRLNDLKGKYKTAQKP
ncbi:dolichyl-phosphate beta-glucosyltransferase [Patescibacteria group bacterium]